MSKNIPGNNKHLSLSDRSKIESMLSQSESFKDMAISLCKDPTTISKEVRLHRQHRAASAKDITWNHCKRKRKCSVYLLCDKICKRPCSACKYKKCNKLCQDFVDDICNCIKQAPYVCNSCDRYAKCRKEKYIYNAEVAHEEYLCLLKEARSGANLTPQSREELNELIRPLIKQGQSIAHICHTNTLPCGERTIYNYIDQGYLRIKNIDLPFKLKYKPRKSAKDATKRNFRYLEGRRYTDYIDYISNHDKPIVQMDTVVGHLGTKKVLLTMQLLNCSILLAFLLDKLSKDYVLKVFDQLEEKLKSNMFKKVFPVILTDRGTEFYDAIALEKSVKNGRRTKMFYCDPNAPFQKAELEKSHTLIRRFFPKKGADGPSPLNNFDHITQEKVTLMINHINNYSRDSLGGRSPMEIAKTVLNKKTVEALDLKFIPHDEVNLNPALLK